MQRIKRATAALLLAAHVVSLVWVPLARAADAANPSDVVIALDFSASILRDGPNRKRFADALERIADRVDATVPVLITGDARVSLVAFATKASEIPDCTDLSLKDSSRAVVKLADCLRSVAGEYRKGLGGRDRYKVGIHTNYVGPMRLAADHLPQDAQRPALILFTDGKHDDPGGVPLLDVLPARDRLLGSRSPFALLPVGMGLERGERDVLADGLEDLRIVREMKPCEGGEDFRWDDVVFESPDEAGVAVATALQQVTCTFTVEPEAPSLPPGSPQGLTVSGGDAAILVGWSAPADLGGALVTDYETRCRVVGSAQWIGGSEGVSDATRTTVAPVANGQPYECEVRAVTAHGAGEWARAPGSAEPYGAPPAPAAPVAHAGDSEASLRAAPISGVPVDTYRFECSGDGGVSWPATAETRSGDAPIVVRPLENGSTHVCRAYAANERGVSPASAPSAEFFPCGSLLQCNPLLLPIIAALLSIGLAVLLFVLWRYLEARKQQWIAVAVDDLPPVNLGRGPDVGFNYLRSANGEVEQVVPDRGRQPDVRVHFRPSDTFQIRTEGMSRDVKTGHPVDVIDQSGDAHSVILLATRRPVRATSLEMQEQDTPFDNNPFATTSGPSNDPWD